MKMMRLFFGFLLTFPVCSYGAIHQPVILDIRVNSDFELEQKGRDLVEDFVKKYDLKPYIFTPTILIQSMAIPHSHPTLTLNTRQISNPDRYLALFIHEQVHWFFNENTRSEKTQAFIAKMKAKYPKVPSRADGGAADDESTYLHIGVCFYELDIMKKLIGADKAEANFKTEDVYSWIRKQVSADHEFIQAALNETGLGWEDANLPTKKVEAQIKSKTKAKKSI